MKRLIVILAMLAGAARAEPPQVLTDIAPVHSLVAQVMGNLGDPGLLLEPTDDVHHMQLRPSQARALEQAGVVFWIGPDLEPWLVDPLATMNPQAVAVALGEGVDHEEHGNHEEESNDSDHGEGSHGGNEHEAHAHGIHPWLDPAAASDWLDTIAMTLADVDPENREHYLANAIEAQKNLKELTAEIQKTLAPLAGSGFVVGHDAYDAFADRFGLSIRASLRDSEESDPGAARLAEVQKLVSSGDVACIFTDAGHSDAHAGLVSQGLNIPIGELDPIGINLTPGPHMYDELLENLAQAFATCQ